MAPRRSRRSPRRASHPTRFVSVPVLASGMLVAVVLTLPWTLAGIGSGRVPFVAGLVAARSGALVASWLLLVVLAVVVLRARVKTVARSLLIPAAALAVVASVAHVVVPATPAAGAASGRSLTVLSWNVNGSLVSGATIAGEALAHHADVVVLPEVNPVEVDEATAQLSPHGYRLVRVAGSNVVVFSTVGYRAADAGRHGSDPSRELVAVSDGGGLPSLYAVHLRIPFSPSGSDAWNREVAWVSALCAARQPALVVGDFNATVDNLAGTPVTTACADAATLVGAQRVGTWPTALPTALGMPIDHVFTAGDGVDVAAFAVLTDQDRSGSRHRPVLATISLSYP